MRSQFTEQPIASSYKIFRIIVVAKRQKLRDKKGFRQKKKEIKEKI